MLKAGELSRSTQEEEPIWFDYKRITIFAIKWPFTNYTLTPTRLIIKKGILFKTEEEIKLYRVHDVSLTQTIFEQINKVGTIVVNSSDSSEPICLIEHIKNSKQVKDMISEIVEQARRQNRVGAAEVIGACADEIY